MDNHFFINTGMPPHLPFDQPSMPPVWRSLAAVDGGAHFQTPATQSSDHLFDSAITSPVSASNSAISNESFVIRELIGKLGGICNSGEISPPATVAGVSSPYLSANNSCYSTPLSSPPKTDIGSVNRAIMESFNTHLGNSISVPPLGSNLPAMPGDPGFVERAARFSPFGSRSFNGRGNQFPCSNTPELSTRFAGGGKLHRVSSSPSINGAQLAAENKTGNDSNPNSRKRKSVPKGKCRDIPCSSPAKVVENCDDSNAKRSKLNEERNGEKTEEDEEEDEIKKQSGNNNTNQKPPEAPKDYIHVRARRGQATDSHSLAERVRREKISERMKLLQDLVPGCNKVTGKALMLEEIINYVQSLQRQVEFLSMKVATINPRLDFNTDTLFQKDVSQPNCSMQQTYPLDGLAPTLYGGHHHHQNSLQQNGIAGSGMGPPCPNPMDPINQNHDMQLPTIDGFNNGVPELCESDLHTIVQMGFSHNTQLIQDNTFQPQSFQGSNQAPEMKTEF